MNTTFPGFCVCGHHRDKHLDVHGADGTSLTACAAPKVVNGDISKPDERCSCGMFRAESDRR